ncbi:MAG: hypothetical protein PHY26_00055 [Bacilli bacterium]|jgi:hypothetical protein|nr:hypothetical protein [Bacilli bacterium]
MEENLKNIELFFNYNMKIKNLMYDLAFKDEYAYNQESLIEYGNKLFKTLDIIESYLLKILLIFEYDEKYIIALKKRFTNYREEFINVQNSVIGLKKVYQKNISDMRKNFIDSVNKSFIGYYLYRGDNVLEPVSINEYLHFLHASIINNEEIYQKMPEIESIGENEYNSIHLYGKRNDAAYEIFKSFPIKDTRVDILSLNDRILIMVRDLGHALMIEVTFKNEQAIVNYFIPKICNYLMANELRGITEVKNDSKYAKGSFEIENNLLKEVLFDFLVKVPKDEDMFKEGGMCYEEKNKKIL